MSAIFAVVFGVIAMLAYGIADFVAAKATRKVGVFQVATISVGVSLVLYAIISVLFLGLPAMSLDTAAMLALTALLFILGTLSYYKGFKEGDVSIVSPIGNAWPIITIALGLVVIGEPLTAINAVSAVLLIIGTALALTNFKKLARTRGGRLAKGATYALGAMVLWGLGFFLIFGLVGRLGWFAPAFLISVASFAYLLAYDGGTRLKFKGIKPVLGLIAVVGVLAVIAELSYNIGVTTTAPLLVAPISAASPAVTVVLALVLLKEKPEAWQRLGIIIILLGLVLASI